MASRATNGEPPRPQSYFEQQRAGLINDIALNLEHVLQNINLLNRSLESAIAVGNEFSQVEGLWSQFENVMAQQPPTQSSQPQQHNQPQQQQQGSTGQSGGVDDEMDVGEGAGR